MASASALRVVTEGELYKSLFLLVGTSSIMPPVNFQREHLFHAYQGYV